MIVDVASFVIIYSGTGIVVSSHQPLMYVIHSLSMAKGPAMNVGRGVGSVSHHVDKAPLTQNVVGVISLTVVATDTV